MTRAGIIVALVALSFSGLARAQDRDDDGPRFDLEPGRGFRVTSADDRFGLVLGGTLQLWATLRELPDGEEENVTLDPRIRRARLAVGGHFFAPENRYFIQVAFSPQDFEVFDGRLQYSPLVDAYLEFTQLRDLNVRVGQMLLPLLRTREVRSQALELPERAFTERSFELGRRYGIQFRSDDLFGLGRLSYRAGVFFSPAPDGRRRAPISLDAAARVQVRLLGQPRLDEQGDLARSPSPRLAVGAGYAFLDDEPAGSGFRDRHVATGDAVFRIAGVALEGAVMWRRDREDDLPQRREEFGGNVQLSYLLPWFDLQAVVRYSGLLDRDADQLRQEWTGGLSYYFYAGHPFKVQLSVGHTENLSVDPVADPFLLANGWSGIAAIQAEL